MYTYWRDLVTNKAFGADDLKVIVETKSNMFVRPSKNQMVQIAISNRDKATLKKVVEKVWGSAQDFDDMVCD